MKKLILALLIPVQIFAQSYTPSLRNVNLWTLTGRTVETIQENGRDGIRFSEDKGMGLWLLKDFMFSEGSIEFDVKGRNVLQRSFLGLAFHYLNDSTYDVVYFRPFNFQNADTSRRIRAVQYISLPHFYWDKLRKDFPGKYEKSVKPVPNSDDWFHVKVVLDALKVRVFVNNSSMSSLEVEKLSKTKSGQIGLWVDTGSDGSFANLVINKNH